MKIRNFRILGAALAALLPACGGGGGGGSGGGTANPAFPVTMTKPSAGQTFTAPATVSLNAVAADPENVTMVEFVEATPSEPLPNAFFGGGKVVATSTQPPFQAIWADVPPGVYTLGTRATDKLGAQTFSNSVTISVLPPGESQGGWVPIARMPSSAICFVDADQGWADGPFHTEDGGATWVAQSTGVPTPLRNVLFIDTDHGWAVEAAGPAPGAVYRTTDGGTTWTSSDTGTGGFSALSFVDPNTGWVLGTGPDFTLFATKDGGITWTPLPHLPDRVLLDIRFVDQLNGWAHAFGPEYRASILNTTDGGLTWTVKFRADPNEGLGPMAFVSATTGWVSRSRPSAEGRDLNDGILFTDDGGETWTVQAYPASDAIVALDFVSPKQGWGAGGSGLIIHTEDGGQSWVTQQSSNPTGDLPIVDVEFIDAHRGWALRSDGILLKTTTGGKAP